MSLQSVRQFLADHAPDIEIIELNQSTATVELAAKAHNVEPGQIARGEALLTAKSAITKLLRRSCSSVSSSIVRQYASL